MLRSPTYFKSSGGCRRAAEERTIGLLPRATRLRQCPFQSRPCLSCSLSFDRSLCDHVCDPTAWPAAATCFMISGCHPACFPMGKKIALALLGQCLEHGRRMSRPWTVIEGQDDLFIAEKIIGLEMLESEVGSASRVDLDNAGNPRALGLSHFAAAGAGLGPGACAVLSPGRCGCRDRDRHGDRKSAHQILHT